MSKYPEITCPYCRIGFGAYKVNNKYTTKEKSWRNLWQGKRVVTGKEVQHMDLFWSYESGLILDCKQQEYVIANTESTDANENPTFKPEFKAKLDELHETFRENPSDISKASMSKDDFILAFKVCMNEGFVDGVDQEYNKEMTIDSIGYQYDSGYNLTTCLKSYLKPITKDDKQEREPGEGK